LLQLGEDADRQFAPRPAEVRAGILKAAPVVTVSQYGSRVSMSACEMMAEARVSQRERSSQADADTDTVARELQQVRPRRLARVGLLRGGCRDYCAKGLPTWEQNQHRVFAVLRGQAHNTQVSALRHKHKIQHILEMPRVLNPS
jgi:hypothetical protein